MIFVFSFVLFPYFPNYLTWIFINFVIRKKAIKIHRADCSSEAFPRWLILGKGRKKKKPRKGWKEQGGEEKLNANRAHAESDHFLPGPLQFPHHRPACQSLPAPVPNSALSLSEGFFLNANLIMSETSDGSPTVFGIKSRPLHPAEDALCDLDRPHRQSGAPFPSQGDPEQTHPEAGIKPQQGNTC